MREFHVTWTIEVNASSPEDAARKAREIMLNPESIADVFEVRPRGSIETETIDLSELDGRDVN